MSRLQTIIDALYQRRRRARIKRNGSATGVLFVSAGGLGDTILLSHVMPRFMRLAEPGEAVTLLLRTDGAKTAFMMPPAITIQTVDFARLRSDRRYRQQTADDLYRANYRLVVSLDYLRHPFLDEFLILACAAGITAGMIARPWRKYTSALAHHQKKFDRMFDSGPAVQDKILRWHRFADGLNGETTPPPMALADPETLAAAFDAPRPFVLCQAFSAVKAKQCAPAVFERALAQLPVDWEIVFTGAPGEDAANPEYAELLSRPGARYDASPFAELVPKLRAAKLAISVDTAFLHLAIATGTPTLGLASAAYIGEIVPYAPETVPPNARFVYHDMPCRSCLGDCRLPPEDGRYPCIARLDSGTVETALSELLAGLKG
ncbi:MAG: glycosyltransferase family 9 protein [Rhodospirillales bacterium]